MIKFGLTLLNKPDKQISIEIRHVKIKYTRAITYNMRGPAIAKSTYQAVPNVVMIKSAEKNKLIEMTANEVRRAKNWKYPEIRYSNIICRLDEKVTIGISAKGRIIICKQLSRSETWINLYKFQLTVHSS
jgi:hypothetical protein